MHDYTEEYKNLLASKFGEDILNSLEKLRLSLIDDAQKSEVQEVAYGLLKSAAGVNLAVSHLKGRAVLPRNKANREV